MVMGTGYRELADWALSDINGWQCVGPQLGIVVLTAAVAVAAASGPIAVGYMIGVEIYEIWGSTGTPRSQLLNSNSPDSGSPIENPAAGKWRAPPAAIIRRKRQSRSAAGTAARP